MADSVGAAYERAASSHYGAHRYFCPTWLFSHGLTLPGHSGEVFATRFDPTGQHIASGSMDRNIRMCTNSWPFITAVTEVNQQYCGGRTANATITAF